MSRDNAVLITGATGSLGSWLASAALGDGMRVCAVARDGGEQSARERVMESLALAGAFDPQRLNVITGDLLARDLGPTLGQVPDDVALIVHCAACTDFAHGSAELSHRTNILGTQHILEFADRRRLPVVHLSTAYVAGRRSGRVREADLDVGQDFTNVYERTKCQSEALLRRWARATRLPAIVLRPGIVAGASDSGRILRFNTIYDIMHALDTVASALRGQTLRIVGCAAVTKNIIPVDHFARMAWQIVRRGIPGTYHVVHQDPPTLAQLRDFYSDLFDIDGLTLVSEEEFSTCGPTQSERIVHRAMSSYRSYMLEAEPVFDRTATEKLLGPVDSQVPRLTKEWFERILQYAREVEWGRKPPTPHGRRQVPGPVAEYFDDFLTSKIGRNLLPNLRRLTAHIAIALREDPANRWVLDVRDGVLQTISRNGMSADCRYTVDAPTLLSIVGGRLSPQQAFFQRRVEITGDIATGLKTAAILSQFFRTFPFEPAAA